MSERKGDDAVRVPIEIKTEDLSELQQLIQELTEAEEASRTTRASGALPARGSAGAQSFAGQAGRSGRQAAAREGPGGIFGGGREGMQATPQTFRDRSGRQAMQRQNQFSALQDQVQQMQDEQMEQTVSLMDQVIGMGTAYIPFLGGTKALSWAQQKLMTRVKQRAMTGGQQAGGIYGGPAGKAATLPAAAGTSRGLLAALGAGASKLMGPIGLAVSAIIASKAFFDMMQGPGGFWDIRYRRHIQKEMDPFIDRREKQEINVGLRTVRVTTAPAQRGTAHIFSTQEAVRKGIPIYDSEFEAFSKGLYL